MASLPEVADSADEPNWKRRVGLAIFLGIAIVTVYTLVYHWMVLTIAGLEERSLIKSTQVVIEALTTAGFGGDTGLWREHDSLALFVLVMNLTGVLLVFLAIPLFGVPLLRNALDPTPPTTADLEEHVIICGYSAMDDVLKDELDEAGVPYLFLESDPDIVKRLNAAGMTAIHGNPERVEALENANADAAIALVADLDDETNPTVILSAHRANPDLQIVSVVGSHESVPYHEFAGADDVVVSKESLGESLAKRSIKTVSERLQDAIPANSAVRFDEYLVTEGSDFVGKTIEEIDAFGGRVRILGGWFGARFLISPPPDTPILENTILLVTGETDHLDQHGLRKLPAHSNHPDRVVVCGYGDVGRAVTRILTERDVDVTVVDRDPIEIADIVGDITKPETLDRAEIDTARSLVLAIDDDATAVYAALLVKDVAPDVEIIARANDPENVWKLYNAGADYVLSLPEVTGEVLASTLIDETTILTPTDDFDFVRTPAPALVGKSIADADIRRRTGCIVVAVDRDGSLETDFGPDYVLQPDDCLIATGDAAALERFESYVG